MTHVPNKNYDTAGRINMTETLDNPRGHKTTLSIRFIARQPMTRNGFESWSMEKRRHISKSRYTFGSNMLCVPNLPIEVLQTDQALGEYCCQYFGRNQVYVYAYSRAKTPTGVGLKCIAIVDIKDSDSRKFRVIKTIRSNKSGRMINRLSRFWFRRDQHAESNNSQNP